MFHCPYCKKLVQAITKAASVAVIICNLCGSVLVAGDDDLPHQAHATAANPAITAMASGSGGGASAVPFIQSDDGSQAVIQQWWRRERERAWRAAVDASMQNQRSLGFLS